MDAIIETLTFSIVLLIVGLGCVVIGVAGLLWLARRDSRGKDSGWDKLTANESFPLISAQPRNGNDDATHRARRGTSRSAGHP
jgi:hypothetical protein